MMQCFSCIYFPGSDKPENMDEQHLFVITATLLHPPVLDTLGRYGLASRSRPTVRVLAEFLGSLLSTRIQVRIKSGFLYIFDDGRLAIPFTEQTCGPYFFLLPELLKPHFRRVGIFDSGTRLELSDFAQDRQVPRFVPRKLLVVLFVAKALALSVFSKAIVGAAVGLTRSRLPARCEERAFLGRLYEQVRVWPIGDNDGAAEAGV